MIIRPNLPSHGAHHGTGHTLGSFSFVFLSFVSLSLSLSLSFLYLSRARARARSLILFHPLTIPASGNLEVAWIAPRRGLVAKMHRCLSYNMLAMHLERVRAPIPDCRQRTRRFESIRAALRLDEKFPVLWDLAPVVREIAARFNGSFNLWFRWFQKSVVLILIVRY